MRTSKQLRFFIGSCVTVLSLVVGCSPAIAADPSVYIQNVYPTGAINPGSTVSFSAVATGFIDPQYSFTDSFSGSGATLGSIDKIGTFTWTPVVYDAGRHTINVIVTDNYNHTSSSTVDILVANNSLIITGLSPGPVVAVNHPVTFTITAPGFITPYYGVYDSYAMSTLNISDTNSSGVFSWTPTMYDLGTHALSVKASDTYGHSAQGSETITVINPTVSVQSLKPGATAGVGSDVSFSTIVSALANPTYSVSDSFSGTSTVMASDISSTGVFAWVPSSSDLGTHVLTVTAADTYGNIASTTATISITTASPTLNAPVVAPAPSTAAAQTSPATPVPAKYVFTTYLAIRSRGTAVQQLQTRLSALGFYTGPITGYFGSLTAAGVKRFQSAHGLARVGFVGPGTRAALNNN
ncbi:MAG: peptidoglycan-binding protein [Minisyncoccota bacterium]